MSGFEYFAVLDFEATCGQSDDEFDVDEQEIIEIPIGLVQANRREVIDTFGAFVRPTRQPRLTAFCTELTSITQDDVDSAPTIDLVMDQLHAWFDEHALSPDNCCIVTCGDWDLRTMWPKQASLVDGLPTHPLFKSWCNLKQVFARHNRSRATGMMGMLRAAGLEHRGHHHRGADDVENLCRLVNHLLAKNARITVTWGDDQREDEHRRHDTHAATLERELAEAASAIDSLPSHVDRDVTARMADRVALLREQHARARRLADVFAA